MPESTEDVHFALQNDFFTLTATLVDELEREPAAVASVHSLANDGKVAVADDAAHLETHLDHDGYVDDQLRNQDRNFNVKFCPPPSKFQDHGGLILNSATNFFSG